MAKKNAQPRKTKLASYTYILQGDLYFEESKQCSMDDERFVDIIEFEKAFRVISFANRYHTEEWLSGVGFTKFDLNVEMTVRAELRNGGTKHWYAYRRVGGVLFKRYVGQSDRLTVKRLLEVAQHLPG